MSAAVVAQAAGVGVLSSTALSLTETTNAIPAGSVLVLMVNRGALSGTANGVASVSVSGESVGLVSSWTRRATGRRANTHDMTLLTAVATGEIPAGMVISVTFNAASNRKAGALVAFSGLTETVQTVSGLDANGLDGSNSSVPNGSGTAVSATTLAAASGNYLVIGVASIAGTATAEPGAGLTEVAEVKTSAGSSDRGFNVMTREDSAASAQTIDATLSASQGWAAMAAVLTLAEAGPPPSALGSVIVGGAKKAVATRSVVIGGAKKTVTSVSVIVGGVKKPLA